jgi:hypothetical protein
LPASFDGEFPWDFLKPAFNGTKIMPMDLDAVIERNGHILCFETKIDGKEIDRGQRITLTAFWKKGCTIFVVRGKTPETITGMSIYWEGRYSAGSEVGAIPCTDCSWDDVLFQTRRWYCRSSEIAVPTRDEWDRELWVWDYDRALESPAVKTASPAATQDGRPGTHP